MPGDSWGALGLGRAPAPGPRIPQEMDLEPALARLDELLGAAGPSLASKMQRLSALQQRDPATGMAPGMAEPGSERMNLGLDIAGNFDLAGIVSPRRAAGLTTRRNLPTDETFKQAVANTKGARVEDDALVLPLWRGQVPEQLGAQSVRGGVFYLPEGSAKRHGYGSAKYNYGGSEHITGETAIHNPLVVKGATGGRAPKEAYDKLKGKGAYEKMRSDVLDAINLYRDRSGNIYNYTAEILEKYGADPQLANIIVPNSRKGNTMPYAIQEAIVAAEVRRAGHDGVLGYGVDRAKRPSFSEWFDTRERSYPDDYSEYTEIFEDYLR